MQPSTGAAVRDRRIAVRHRSELVSAINRNHCPPSPESAAEPTLNISAFFKRCWSALQERRKRARLRAALYALPDRHLRDIGIAWSEIEYLAVNGTDERVDPR